MNDEKNKIAIQIVNRKILFLHIISLNLIHSCFDCLLPPPMPLPIVFYTYIQVYLSICLSLAMVSIYEWLCVLNL